MRRLRRREKRLRAGEGRPNAVRVAGRVPILTRPGRLALLAGTALVSTLVIGLPTPSRAQIAVFRPASPFPVNVTNNRDCIFPGTCALIDTILPFGSIKLTNNGDFTVAGLGAAGIFTNTIAPFSPITIINNGDIATAGFGAVGIYATTDLLAGDSPISITNTGDIATIGISAFGIYGYTGLRNGKLKVTNSGNIATRAFNADGMYLVTVGRNSDISVVNSGEIASRGRFAEGINAYTFGNGSSIKIVNSGDVTTRGLFSDAINATTFGRDSSIVISNSGNSHALGAFGYGIDGRTYGRSSTLTIENSGDVFGSFTGVYGLSRVSTTIVNSGTISAGNGLAIDTVGGGTTISNSGMITGFVDLTNQNDLFENEAGGEFKAMDRSNFRRGNDVFRNLDGATLRVASLSNQREGTDFVGLEKFDNRGLITMQDGQTNDVFTISNTPGGKDLSFSGSGNSTLAVDTFLGGPGSTSDVLVVEGSTSGRTRLEVHNTNQSSARYDPVGIPVVFVEGDVKSSNFYLDKPVDGGFFDYDLIFHPTGSGFFALENHTGGGSHLLPQVVTAAHETFHNTSETWFDQSTDLRVLLAQGSVCDDPARPEDRIRCQELYNFTPGVWARGSGAWLDLEDTATTNANGRTYRHHLDRDFDVWNFESGIDFGKRDLLADGDILVFGFLGGGVASNLEYKHIDRAFTMKGGEVGTYATYLRGGLFVDTLFKTIFAEVNPQDIKGFPDTLNNTTYGLRSDAGYRFGGMRYGPFVEPLGSIVVSWNELEDFTKDGNAVDFGDDEEVRGRIGLRLGTSANIWEGTTFEPFVVGSLWSTLSGDHHATLVSSGTTFQFTDDTEDLWGVVSVGVNFFNPSAQTAVFAKVDYTIGNEIEGIGAKGGLRYNW